jgi:hypothetical protein
VSSVSLDGLEKFLNDAFGNTIEPDQYAQDAGGFHRNHESNLRFLSFGENDSQVADMFEEMSLKHKLEFLPHYIYNAAQTPFYQLHLFRKLTEMPPHTELRLLSSLTSLQIECVMYFLDLADLQLAEIDTELGLYVLTNRNDISRVRIQCEAELARRNVPRR